MNKQKTAIYEQAKVFNKIDDNPYFKRLLLMPYVSNFLKSQEAFISAVDNWSKVLIKMLSIVPSVIERQKIIENLYDEHGGDDVNKAHVNTFQQFMTSMGYSDKLKIYYDYDSYKHVKQFNDSIEEVISKHHWTRAVAMLGMIEYTYITVSKNIHNYAANYMNKENIHHYSIHEIMDTKHATDLFDLVAPYTVPHQMDIYYGIADGYNIINTLYDKLSEYLD